MSSVPPVPDKSDLNEIIQFKFAVLKIKKYIGILNAN